MRKNRQFTRTAEISLFAALQPGFNPINTLPKAFNSSKRNRATPPFLSVKVCPSGPPSLVIYYQALTEHPRSVQVLC